MGFSWFESILYGIISGLTDILPVSAQAHKLILQKMLGINYEPVLMTLLIHLAVLAALYFNCTPMIVKISRALKLSRIPKKKRKRPLDTKSLMDFRLLRTMLFPIILAFFFYQKVASVQNNLISVACMVLVNGFVLYIPQYLPGSNKDSRMLSRVEGFLMGLGGALSVVPGFSGMAMILSVGSVCGIERSYGLSVALLMNMALLAGKIIFAIIDIFSGGIGVIDFAIFLNYLAASLAAFLGTTLGIRTMRYLASESGFGIFAYYCWGVALFTFILNLLA